MTPQDVTLEPRVGADSLLVCKDIVKNYGGVRALRGVDIEIRTGEVHGLVGPNGAGKSTLVKIIAGAVSPSSGVVEYDGMPLCNQDPRQAAGRGIALVPQELTTVPTMSVAENITLGSEPVRRGWYDRKEAQSRAARALAVVGLELDPGMPVDLLSPTYQRLVMIATAFDRHARLVILDEPTAGLPPDEAAIVLAAVDRLRISDVAVVYVSHHLSEVARACNPVTCIREGRAAGRLAGADVTKEALIDLIHDATGAPSPGPAITMGSAPRTADPDVSAVVLEDVSTCELSDVSVRIPSTGVTGIAGLLGSGAKDLAAVLAGAVRHQSGTIVVNGTHVKAMTPTVALGHGVTYLAGDRSRSALRASTITENVSLSALRAWSTAGFLRRGHERRSVWSILQTLGVTADPLRDIGELSGGNQQRVLVGRCLASNATLVVLDEPTIGVDVASREELWAAVRVIARTRAVVVASSEPEELVALCSQVICLAGGRVVDVIEESRLSVPNITTAIA